MDPKSIAMWSLCVLALIVPFTSCAPQLIGCYKDSIFRAMVSKGNVKSVDECIEVCQKSGLSPAGVQYSKQCFCGGNYKKYGPAKNCNMKCKSGEICGGFFALSVYEVGEPDCYCSASGDPHYRTFDGQMIHFMGICKYTLATSTKGAPNVFAVEVKNEHRGNTRVSYTRMVDVTLKGVTVRLLPRNKILVNGEIRSLPINSDLGFGVTYSGGWVTVTTKWGLRVQFDGKHRVSVKVPNSFANMLTGICGNCNRKKDDYRTKEGKDVSKIRNKFSLIGNSFSVNDDSDRPLTKCAVTDVNLKCPPTQTQRCNIIMQATFGACRKKLGPIRVKEYIESCKMDTCMYHKNKENINTVFCESIEGLVRECEKSGVAVNWRKISKCALKCDSNKVYQFDAFACQPSCTNRKPKCTVRAEGCVCTKGFLLSGDKCVRVSECGCVHKGNYLVVKEVFTDSKCKSKITCQANGKVKTEKMKPCGDNSVCGLVNGVRSCMCKTGFHLQSGKCVSKAVLPPKITACEKTVADIVFLIDDSGSVKVANFEKMKTFMINIVHNLKIGSKHVRVAAVSFSSRAVVDFYLNKYHDKKQLITQIKNIKYRKGGTNTHLGLKLLHTVFSTVRGDRKDVPNIVIVLTDGKSAKSRSTKLEAAKLQKSGVVMFSIGIGKNIRKSELEAMASNPKSEHNFNVDNFDALQSITKDITTKTCTGKVPNLVVPTPKVPGLIGCYKDSMFRAMVSKGNVKSVDECIDICKKSGLSPAGLQYSKQCFCGGNYKKYGPAKNCNMKCKSGEICGGFFALSVYEVGEPDCYCSASGDPHYRTFDGQMIHFMGICKYTLATSTKGAPNVFAVEVKNEHRGNTRVSYTRMVDVTLKGVTVRLLPRNKILVNGERRSLPINSDLGFAVTYSGGWVTVTTKWGLRVQFDGKHRVSVKVPNSFANMLTGICGNCNRKKDDYRTKEGKDVSKIRNKFSLIGNSFSVNDDSDRPLTKCAVTDVNLKCPTTQTQRCNIIMQATFGACRKKLGPIRVKEYIESCKMDTCMYHKNKENINTVFCESIEGLVRECEKSGVAVNWRKISKCALKCDSNKVYQFDAFACQPSCTNRKPKCTVRAEGCVCKKGFLLSGDKCVRVSECGCVHKGNYLVVKEVFTDSKCKSKITCHANGKVKTEKMKPCGDNSVCGLVNGVRSCMCKTGFHLQSRKCVSKAVLPPKITACEKTVADIVFLIDDSGSVKVANFEKMKTFMINIVHNLKIGSKHVRVAAVSFSSRAVVDFYLNKYHDKKQLITQIKNIKYRKGGTNTHLGLKLLHTVFSTVRGDRKDVPNIVIVLTDGKSAKSRSTKLEAAKLQKSGVVMFSIGIGKNIRKSELEAMASNPKSEHNFNVDNFDALQSITKDITTKTCTGRVPNLVVPTPKVPGLIGCYKDSMFRAMVSKGNVKSVDECIDICKKSGLSPAGLQYSKQCFCGGNYKKYGPAKNCNMKCKSGEICGGFFALSVYEVGEPDCYCSASGDPHYRTFDGQMIHFMGICKYTLATSTKGAPNVFAVEVKNEHRGNTRVSYTRMVDVTLKGVTVRLLPRNKILVNGERRSLPINSDLGFAVTYSGGWVTVTTKWGLRVQFDGKHRVSVKVPNSFANMLTGICGNCNRKKDDYRTKEGKDVSKIRNKFSLIGNSFSVNDDSDRPLTKCAVTDVNLKCPPTQTQRCNIIMQATFGACRKKLGPIRVKEYIESCKMDTCMYHKNKENINTVFCESIEGLVRECEKSGVAVNWRKISKCALKCDSNKVYQFDAFACQPSCTNRKPKCTVRAEGCVCKKGFLLSGDKCVRVSECGCVHKGNYLVVKEVFTDSKCKSKITCHANGKVKTDKMKPCGDNSVCGLVNGVRSCMCKTGFHLQSRKCVSKAVLPPKITACEKTVADIVFLIDDSGSVKVANFEKMKTFMINIVHNLKIGSKHVRVAAVSFSSRAVVDFYLNKYHDKKQLITQIKNIKYRKGGTNTHLGLKLLHTVFSTVRGDRKDVPNIVIVLTDGKSAKSRSTKLEAAKLQKSGVVMFSIGIGKNIRKSELEAMASNPKSEHNFNVDNFDALQSITKDITTNTCTGKVPNLVNPCYRKPCKNGGVCAIADSGYKCICKKGFNGKHCERRIPDCVCSASGDPHYKTFDGQWIHFMGVCKYTLTTPKKTSRLPHFSVEVKNEHRGNTRVSYTRLVDLKINGATIRLLPGSKISINGELLNLPLKKYMGVSAVYSAGWVKVTTSFGVKVQFDGRHRVVVRVPSVYRNQLTGICGDCNAKKDDYKTRAGVDVSGSKSRYSLIGKSYEVIDDSDKPQKQCEVVDFVQKCQKKELNACTLLTNTKGPFAKCLTKLGSAAKEYFKSCQTDVCAYTKVAKVFKTVVCQTYEALAKKCEELNVLINWRHETKCPMKCLKDKMFAYKTSTCQPSCANRKPVCADGFTEGCVCKPGTILSGDKCVHPSLCGCEFEGIYLKAGEEFLLNDCSERIICGTSGKIKKIRGCAANTICVIRGGMRKCACKEGFEMINGICRKILVPPPPIVDPNFLGPVLHMFIRVSVAYKEGKPIQTISTKAPKACAHHCLNHKQCKSFNFDLLLEKCQLFSTNAEKHTLIPSYCPYQDYYQLIESKNIFIRGATIFTCVHLNEYAPVKTLAECRIKCTNDKCKAMEFSVGDEECSVTHTTREKFGLIGDDEFVYYETLDQMPQLPVN